MQRKRVHPLPESYSFFVFLLLTLPLLLSSCGKDLYIPETVGETASHGAQEWLASKIGVQPKLGLNLDVIPSSLLPNASEFSQSKALNLIPSISLGLDLFKNRQIQSIPFADNRNAGVQSAVQQAQQSLPVPKAPANLAVGNATGEGSNVMTGNVMAQAKNSAGNILNSSSLVNQEPQTDVKVMKVIELANGVRLQKVVTVSKTGGPNGTTIHNVSTYNVSKQDTLNVVSEYAVTNEKAKPLCCNSGGVDKIINNTMGNTAYGGDAGDIDAVNQINSNGKVSN